ncbi:CASP-like protein 4D [Parasponia andersonii]|uniref:CASP-like protein n=1 Tax=Parasponia andersonii TaxID=3476 RepID=A0A2P5C6H7_PARAD|nr:CASP-like protein 4D [Parasponia andersonii]
MESTIFSKGLRIITLALRVTTIIFLLISLIILVTNVLRVPYGEDVQVETFHFYDVAGFKYMLYIIVIVIGYSTLQIIFMLLQKNDVMSSDPNFLCVYYGEWASSILLVLGSVAGYSSTKEYQKWLADSASEYEAYFRKSYTAASMFLLAFLCTFISSFIYSCALYNTPSSRLDISKNSSKVNAVLEEP